MKRRPEPKLSHVDEATGEARMVDVSAKPVTARVATAAGRVLVSPEVIALLRGEGVPKGDAVAAARIAGIAGAKRTPDLVPLCHPIAIHGVRLVMRLPGIRVVGRLEPVLDERIATLDRFAVGLVRIAHVVVEQGAERGGIVAAPGVEVPV